VLLQCRDGIQQSLSSLAVGDGPHEDSHRVGTQSVTLDDVARITADQVAALAGFVDQVNPDLLQQLLSMLTWRRASLSRLPTRSHG
jgi:hypothetical protein